MKKRTKGQYIWRKTGTILMAFCLMLTGIAAFPSEVYAYASTSDRTVGNYYCKVQAYATGNDTGGSYYVAYLQNNSSTFSWMFGTWGYTADHDITCGTSESVSIYGPSCGHNYDYGAWSYMAVTQLDVFLTPLHATAYHS